MLLLLLGRGRGGFPRRLGTVGVALKPMPLYLIVLPEVCIAAQVAATPFERKERRGAPPVFLGDLCRDLLAQLPPFLAKVS